MMRQLMEDGHIHEDIVTKLWQIYSTSFQTFVLSLR